MLTLVSMQPSRNSPPAVDVCSRNLSVLIASGESKWGWGAVSCARCLSLVRAPQRLDHPTFLSSLGAVAVPGRKFTPFPISLDMTIDENNVSRLGH